MSAIAPSRRAAIDVLNPVRRRPTATTASAANEQASDWYIAIRYGIDCADRNAATAPGSSRLGPREVGRRMADSKYRSIGTVRRPSDRNHIKSGSTSAGNVSASIVPAWTDVRSVENAA